MAYSLERLRVNMAAEDTVRGTTKSSNYVSMGMTGNAVTYTKDDPWVQYLGQTADTVDKALAFNKIKLMLQNQPAPAGSKNNNLLDYFQEKVRASGKSKDKTPYGIIGLGDEKAIKDIAAAAVNNGYAPTDYLNYYAKYNTAPAPKVKDTSTTYNKQVATALLLKDEGDARLAWRNAHFTAFGSYPPEASNETFGKAWNSQVKSQASTASTQYVTTYEPMYDKKSKIVIDPKTKKQKIDEFGNKVFAKPLLDKLGEPSYNVVNKYTETKPGEGFTAAEQEQFLSEYLVKNHPSTEWDIKTLGGQAKTTYDDLMATISANYGATQDLSTLGPVIAQALGNADPKVSAEVIKKFKDDQRKAAGIKYMGIAEYTNAGDDANKYIAPLMKTASDYLETNVAIDDPIMKKFLNFQGSDGKYRLPNDYEIEQEVKKDSRYQKTSRAKNDVVNLFQSLKDQLGR